MDNTWIFGPFLVRKNMLNKRIMLNVDVNCLKQNLTQLMNSA